MSCETCDQLRRALERTQKELEYLRIHASDATSERRALDREHALRVEAGERVTELEAALNHQCVVYRDWCDHGPSGKVPQIAYDMVSTARAVLGRVKT